MIWNTGGNDKIIWKEKAKGARRGYVSLKLCWPMKFGRGLLRDGARVTVQRGVFGVMKKGGLTGGKVPAVNRGDMGDKTKL